MSKHSGAPAREVLPSRDELDPEHRLHTRQEIQNYLDDASGRPVDAADGDDDEMITTGSPWRRVMRHTREAWRQSADRYHLPAVGLAFVMGNLYYLQKAARFTKHSLQSESGVERHGLSLGRVRNLRMRMLTSVAAVAVGLSLLFIEGGDTTDEMRTDHVRNKAMTLDMSPADLLQLAETADRPAKEMDPQDVLRDFFDMVVGDRFNSTQAEVTRTTDTADADAQQPE
ncbi:MAG: hypothetical protein MHM6MM_000038 [Cercozoa sp. M6MM]